MILNKYIALFNIQKHQHYEKNNCITIIMLCLYSGVV